MNESKNERMKERNSEKMKEWNNEIMNGWKNDKKRVKEWKNERMKEWKDERIRELWNCNFTPNRLTDRPAKPTKLKWFIGKLHFLKRYKKERLKVTIIILQKCKFWINIVESVIIAAYTIQPLWHLAYFSEMRDEHLYSRRRPSLPLILPVTLASRSTSSSSLSLSLSLSHTQTQCIIILKHNFLLLFFFLAPFPSS